MLILPLSQSCLFKWYPLLQDKKSSKLNVNIFNRIVMQLEIFKDTFDNILSNISIIKQSTKKNAKIKIIL